MYLLNPGAAHFWFSIVPPPVSDWLIVRILLVFVEYGLILQYAAPIVATVLQNLQLLSAILHLTSDLRQRRGLKTIEDRDLRHYEITAWLVRNLSYEFGIDAGLLIGCYAPVFVFAAVALIRHAGDLNLIQTVFVSTQVVASLSAVFMLYGNVYKVQSDSKAFVHGVKRSLAGSVGSEKSYVKRRVRALRPMLIGVRNYAGFRPLFAVKFGGMLTFYVVRLLFVLKDKSV